MRRKKHIFESLTPAEIEAFLKEQQLADQIESHAIFKHVITQSAQDHQTPKQKIAKPLFICALICFLLVGFKFYPQLERVINNFFGQKAATVIPVQTPILIKSNEIELELVASFSELETNYQIIKINHQQDLAIDALSATNITLIRNITPSTEKKDSYFLLQQNWQPAAEIRLSYLVGQPETVQQIIEADLTEATPGTQTKMIYPDGQSALEVLALSDIETKINSEFSLMGFAYIDQALHLQLRTEHYFNQEILWQLDQKIKPNLHQQALVLKNKTTGAIIQPNKQVDFFIQGGSPFSNEPALTEFVFTDFPKEQLEQVDINFNGTHYAKIIPGEWIIPMGENSPLPTKKFQSENRTSTIILTPIGIDINLGEVLSGPSTVTAIFKDGQKNELLKLEADSLPSNVNVHHELNYLDLTQIESLKINDDLYTAQE